MPDKLLKVTDVAELLGVTSRQIWKLTSSGRMPRPVRIGASRSVRWRAADLDTWISAGCPLEWEPLLGVEASLR